MQFTFGSIADRNADFNSQPAMVAVLLISLWRAVLLALCQTKTALMHGFIPSPRPAGLSGSQVKNCFGAVNKSAEVHVVTVSLEAKVAAGVWAALEFAGLQSTVVWF